MVYRGRFAPSPTGPLHFGSLVTAVGSYLDARAQNGQWLLRIEDLDRFRTAPDAVRQIMKTLESLGFEWDGAVFCQSERLDLYHDMLERLKNDKYVYPCACSRRKIEAAAARISIDGGPLYPGICRNGLPGGAVARSWRMRVSDRIFSFIDRVQGEIRQNLEYETGDFVLFRADGQYAYQLAVVVDDALQGVNAVVRGADLIDSTTRQLYLQHCLGFPTPMYAHLPAAVDPAGKKLSKQTRAPAVDPKCGASLLADALHFLGHDFPGDLRHATLAEFWRWSIAHWSIDRVPARRELPAPVASVS
ncbi:MAG: tRNA glutamyl-Q(34) synthetase GluQRS [Candidatus Accumulibacter sp.]|jgi:glutamyl-Q tRNA(Asp) synthetase|nr:tRNA glutamyl-Q(34) synthetase GluQRS [Accumulibacter sp.]